MDTRKICLFFLFFFGIAPTLIIFLPLRNYPFDIANLSKQYPFGINLIAIYLEPVNIFPPKENASLPWPSFCFTQTFSPKFFSIEILLGFVLPSEIRSTKHPTPKPRQIFAEQTYPKRKPDRQKNPKALKKKGKVFKEYGVF